MSTYMTTVKDDFEDQSEITVKEAAGDGEVTTTPDVWKRPFLTTDKYGEPTGVHYYRCRDCGQEVLEGINKEHVSCWDGCRFKDH